MPYMVNKSVLDVCAGSLRWCCTCCCVGLQPDWQASQRYGPICSQHTSATYVQHLLTCMLATTWLVVFLFLPLQIEGLVEVPVVLELASDMLDRRCPIFRWVVYIEQVASPLC